MIIVTESQDNVTNMTQMTSRWSIRDTTDYIEDPMVRSQQREMVKNDHFHTSNYFYFVPLVHHHTPSLLADKKDLHINCIRYCNHGDRH